VPNAVRRGHFANVVARTALAEAPLQGSVQSAAELRDTLAQNTVVVLVVDIHGARYLSKEPSQMANVKAITEWHCRLKIEARRIQEKPYSGEFCGGKITAGRAYGNKPLRLSLFL